MDKTRLIDEAIKAREMSYCPYSGFAVGAALLASNGTIYRGCNIENAAFSPTNCAERTAFFKAVSEGEREFVAIAIVGGPKYGIKDYAYPCGVCRQVMEEFCNPKEFVIITAINKDKFKEFRLEEIQPFGFGPNSL